MKTLKAIRTKNRLQYKSNSEGSKGRSGGPYPPSPLDSLKDRRAFNRRYMLKTEIIFTLRKVAGNFPLENVLCKKLCLSTVEYVIESWAK